MAIFDNTPLPTVNKHFVYLVVDDFDTMCKVTVNQLRSLGAERILTAKNGAEALSILKAHHVDMVLSDWSMPVMSGLDLLKATLGWMAFAAAAIPPIRPPPPTATTSVSRSGTSSNISRATVACPAMTSASSKGCTKVKPRSVASSTACERASSNSAP